MISSTVVSNLKNLALPWSPGLLLHHRINSIWYVQLKGASTSLLLSEEFVELTANICFHPQIDLDSPLFPQTLTSSSSTTATRSLTHIPLAHLLTLCLRPPGPEDEIPHSEVKAELQRRLDPTDGALHLNSKKDHKSENVPEQTEDRSWLSWTSTTGWKGFESGFMRKLLRDSKNNQKPTSIISFPVRKVSGPAQASVRYRSEWEGIDFKLERAELEKWRVARHQTIRDKSLALSKTGREDEFSEEGIEKIVTRKSQVISRTSPPPTSADLKSTPLQSSQPSTLGSMTPSRHPQKPSPPTIPRAPSTMAERRSAPNSLANLPTVLGPRKDPNFRDINLPTSNSPSAPKLALPNSPAPMRLPGMNGPNIQTLGGVVGVGSMGTVNAVPIYGIPRPIPSVTDQANTKPAVGLPRPCPQPENTLKRKGVDLAREEITKGILASKLNGRVGGLGVGAGVGPKVTDGRVIRAIPKRFTK